MKKKLNIKSIVTKILRENEEPFFYLAPDVIGSINNPVRDQVNKIVIIGLNLVDGDKMKLVVPDNCYDNWKEQNTSKNNFSFVKDFLNGSKGVEKFDDIDNLNEIVDEYNNLFNDSQDKPINIRSNAGYYNTKSGDQATKQFISRYQRLISPLGYGGVVW